MTDTKITPFLFEGEGLVRTIERDGAPWFVAKDVALTLGYKDPAKAIAAHCKRAVAVSEGVGESPTPLDPQTKIIPEGDVFRLIFRSALPAAERFEAWVMEEVLPSIRRTGRYQQSIAAEDGEVISAESPDSLKLRTVSLARQVFGERAAGQMWFALKLLVVPAMKPMLDQFDLLETETVTVTRKTTGGTH